MTTPQFPLKPVEDWTYTDCQHALAYTAFLRMEDGKHQLSQSPNMVTGSQAFTRMAYAFLHAVKTRSPLITELLYSELRNSQPLSSESRNILRCCLYQLLASPTLFSEKESTMALNDLAKWYESQTKGGWAAFVRERLGAKDDITWDTLKKFPLGKTKIAPLSDASAAPRNGKKKKAPWSDAEMAATKKKSVQFVASTPLGTKFTTKEGDTFENFSDEQVKGILGAMFKENDNERAHTECVQDNQRKESQIQREHESNENDKKLANEEAQRVHEANEGRLQRQHESETGMVSSVANVLTNMAEGDDKTELIRTFTTTVCKKIAPPEHRPPALDLQSLARPGGIFADSEDEDEDTNPNSRDGVDALGRRGEIEDEPVDVAFVATNGMPVAIAHDYMGRPIALTPVYQMRRTAIPWKTVAFLFSDSWIGDGEYGLLLECGSQGLRRNGKARPSKNNSAKFCYARCKHRGCPASMRVVLPPPDEDQKSADSNGADAMCFVVQTHPGCVRHNHGDQHTRDLKFRPENLYPYDDSLRPYQSNLNRS